MYTLTLNEARFKLDPYVNPLEIENNNKFPKKK